MELDGCVLPEDRLYDLENDVWLSPEADGGTMRLGILGTLASFVGKILSVSFRPLEGVVPRGRSVGTLESFRYTGPVRLPLEATIIERNEELLRRPKLINDSPYNLGWIVRLRPAKPEQAKEGLETAGEIAPRLKERIRTLRIHCYPAIPDLELYEIGLECSAVLAKLDEELARLAPGDVVLLVTDDPTSRIEMVRWEDRTGHRVLHHRLEGDLHHFLVRREEHPVPKRRAL